MLVRNMHCSSVRPCVCVQLAQAETYLPGSWRKSKLWASTGCSGPAQAAQAPSPHVMKLNQPSHNITDTAQHFRFEIISAYSTYPTFAPGPKCEQMRIKYDPPADSCAGRAGPVLFCRGGVITAPDSSAVITSVP